MHNQLDSKVVEAVIKNQLLGRCFSSKHHHTITKMMAQVDFSAQLQNMRF
jgi:hypothetical protein